MKLGLVSNCWQHLLQAGDSLESLCQQALDAGLTYVELRQTCLGNCEDADHQPKPDALGKLADQVRGMQWNLAINHPVFSSNDLSNATFQAAIESVVAIDKSCPHLRIVDLSLASPESLPNTEAAAECVAKHAEVLGNVGGVLSLEHSIQPWDWFESVFVQANQLLKADGNSLLKLCYDACNLLFPADGVDPNEITAGLDIQSISMIHFKQRQDGRVLDTMQDGDIDWSTQLSLWAEKEYDGPALFEIAPSQQVWTRLSDSQQYLLDCHK